LEQLEIEMTRELHALVIDDEPQVREFVGEVLTDEGWSVHVADTAERAFEMLRDTRWSLVFCDVMLGGLDGFAVLSRFTKEQPKAHVILMTGHGSAVGALDATAFGAYDYLLKPFSVDEVRTLARSVLSRLPSRRKGGKEDDESRQPPIYKSDIDLIGSSPAFVDVMKLVGRVAPTNLPVFIAGESGTGKEVVARAVHFRSRRADRPFIALNCGALPAELIESELFGHVKGAFTGAERDRPGLWEEADGGTVFLDEITETTPAFQVKLLRALQNGEIRRVGSNRTTHVDVRVIAATNRDIEPEVSAGRFRQDLLYRLNAVAIRLPPLRERPTDISLLAKYFAAKVREKVDEEIAFSTEAMKLLEDYPWPGNIRELENAVVRAAALCDTMVRPEDLPERILKGIETSPEGTTEMQMISAGIIEEWPLLSELEGRYVRRVLAHTGGNKQAASRILGVDRKTIERMIKRHQIDLTGEIQSPSQD
jgi:two-component system, NtrC family, response regulator AtoC